MAPEQAAGTPGRRAGGRRLRPGRDPLRDAHRPSAVQGRDADGDGPPGHRRRAGAPVPARAQGRPRPGDHLPEVPEQGAAEAIRLGRGPWPRTSSASSPASRSRPGARRSGSAGSSGPAAGRPSPPCAGLGVAAFLGLTIGGLAYEPPAARAEHEAAHRLGRRARPTCGRTARPRPTRPRARRLRQSSWQTPSASHRGRGQLDGSRTCAPRVERILAQSKAKRDQWPSSPSASEQQERELAEHQRSRGSSTCGARHSSTRPASSWTGGPPRELRDAARDGPGHLRPRSPGPDELVPRRPATCGPDRRRERRVADGCYDLLLILSQAVDRPRD